MTSNSQTNPSNRSELVTLETLLRMTVPVPAGCVAPEGSPMTPEFRVSVQSVREDGVHFIIHAHGHDGDTLDLVARGNAVIPLSLAATTQEASPDVVERVFAQIDEAERAMIEERKAQYGSAFKPEQQVAIEAMHRQQRAGARLAITAIRGESA